MKKFAPFLFLAVLIFVSVACSSTSYTATPTPVSALAQGMTMMSDRLNAEATQQKFDSIIAITQQVEAATATQEAAFVEATQIQQARFDAQATADKQDADAQATAQQARRDVIATQQRIDADSTQQAVNAQATQNRLDLEATQAQSRLDLVATQQMGGTATAGVMTMTAIPPAATLTQIANEQSIRLATNAVELSNLKVKQQQDTNVIQWLIPMLIAILAAGVGAVYVFNILKVREVKDGNGDIRLLVYKNQKALAPQLMPGTIVDLETNNMPAVTDPTNQAEIVRREQGVRALEVMPDNPSPHAVGAYNDIFVGPQQNIDLPFDVIDADEQPPAGLLDDQTLQTLRRDWKEAKSDE